MPLPFEPEHHVKAVARFDAALDTEPYVAGQEPRPGVQRRHVFDFEDGLRLLISREQYPVPPGKPPVAGIHLSVSLNEDSTNPIAREIENAIETDRFPGVPAHNVATSVLGHAAVARFRMLCGYNRKLRSRQVSPSGVIHYSIPLGAWGTFMREKTRILTDQEKTT